MTLDEHLKWLLQLMSSPFEEGWKGHCWHRARELAKQPEYADLPRLLTEAMNARPSASTSPER